MRLLLRVLLLFGLFVTAYGCNKAVDECAAGATDCDGNTVRECSRDDCPMLTFCSAYETRLRWHPMENCGDRRCVLGLSTRAPFCAMDLSDPRCSARGGDAFCDGETVVRCRDGYPTSRSDATSLSIESPDRARTPRPFLFAGEEAKLRALRKNQCAEHDVTARATFGSSASNVASVELDGLLRAIGPGTATITAQEGGEAAAFGIEVRARCESDVLATPAGGIEITSAGDARVSVGETLALSAIATWDAADCSSDVTESAAWVSDDPEIATVASTGIVTGLRPGTATLVVSYAGHQAARWVHVDE